MQASYLAPTSPVSCADVVLRSEGNIRSVAHGKMLLDTAESETLSMYGNFKRENREILLVSILLVFYLLSGGTVGQRLRRYSRHERHQEVR